MKKKGNKKNILILVITIMIGVLIGFIIGKNQVSGESDSTTTTKIVETQVSTQTIEKTLTGSGQITAASTEKLSLSTSKYFKTMCVEEDDKVLAGDPILQYSNGTYLTANYDCVIVSYSVPDTGSICTSSHYVEVENLETLAMTLSIEESEINNVEVGQSVEIVLSAYEDVTYEGTITKINATGTYSSSGSSFTTTIQFENDGNAKVGMSASCTILLQSVENAIAVPVAAVQTENGNKYVVIVKSDGTTENVTIETGISDDSYVQVLSGLTGNETIQMIQTTSNITFGLGSSSSSSSTFSGMGGSMPSSSGGNMPSFSGGEMPSR